jgi:hypothetical protein
MTARERGQGGSGRVFSRYLTNFVLQENTPNNVQYAYSVV